MNKENAYYFIVNPAADTGRLEKKWPEVLEYIQENFDIEIGWGFTEGVLMGHKLFLKAVEDGYTNIISVGGDGMANEILNIIMENDLSDKVTLGILPMGTSNEIHLSYNMPFDYKEALKILLGGKVMRVPVGKITGDFETGTHYILNHTDAGLSSLTAISANNGVTWIKGEIKYYIYALKNIIKFKENKGVIKLDGKVVLNDDGETFDSFSVVVISMGELLGGFKLLPDNNMQKEGFAVVVAGYRSRFGLLRLLLQADSGKHIGKPNVVYARAKKIEIEFKNSWPWEGEGEIYAENSKSLTIEFIDDAINMIVPVGFEIFNDQIS